MFLTSIIIQLDFKKECGTSRPFVDYLDFHGTRFILSHSSTHLFMHLCSICSPFLSRTHPVIFSFTHPFLTTHSLLISLRGDENAARTYFPITCAVFSFLIFVCHLISFSKYFIQFISLINIPSLHPPF